MNLASTIFYTNDVGSSAQFYRDVLGFKLEYQNGDRYVSFIFPNGTKLGVKRKDEERELPGAQTVVISVENGVEDWYKILREKGVPVYKKLTTQKWGKNFAILDPDKNKVEFVEKPV